MRIRGLNSRPISPKGDFVLYWMIAARRTTDNFALDRAVELAKELKKPLLVLEALRLGYRWANDRLHRFVMDGMAANLKAFEKTNVRYYPFVERERHPGTGLLEALAARAAAVVTDDYPCFFLPRMVSAAAEHVPVQMEAVDSNGILPMAATDRIFLRAYDFRRYLDDVLPEHMASRPNPAGAARAKLPPLRSLPRKITQRWPPGLDVAVSDLPIDHGVGVTPTRGGQDAAKRQLKLFMERIDRYGEDRNHPDRRGSSGLSPWLHFGHLSPHRVLRAVQQVEKSESTEAFLDELITCIGMVLCTKMIVIERCYEAVL